MAAEAKAADGAGSEVKVPPQAIAEVNAKGQSETTSAEPTMPDAYASAVQASGVEQAPEPVTAEEPVQSNSKGSRK